MVRRAGSDVVVGVSTVQCTQTVRGNLGPQMEGRPKSRRDGQWQRYCVYCMSAGTEATSKVQCAVWMCRLLVGGGVEAEHQDQAGVTGRAAAAAIAICYIQSERGRSDTYIHGCSTRGSGSPPAGGCLHRIDQLRLCKPSLPLVLRRFWPWFDHPRAQWVGGEPHVLDGLQQTRARPSPTTQASTPTESP